MQWAFRIAAAGLIVGGVAVFATFLAPIRLDRRSSIDRRGRGFRFAVARCGPPTVAPQFCFSVADLSFASAAARAASASFSLA